MRTFLLGALCAALLSLAAAPAAFADEAAVQQAAASGQLQAYDQELGILCKVTDQGFLSANAKCWVPAKKPVGEKKFSLLELAMNIDMNPGTPDTVVVQGRYLVYMLHCEIDTDGLSYEAKNKLLIASYKLAHR